MKLKLGERIQIGDATITVNQTRSNQVCLAIKAKRSTLIKKLP